MISVFTATNECLLYCQLELSFFSTESLFLNNNVDKKSLQKCFKKSRTTRMFDDHRYSPDPLPRLHLANGH